MAQKLNGINWLNTNKCQNKLFAYVLQGSKGNGCGWWDWVGVVGIGGVVGMGGGGGNGWDGVVGG